MFQFWVFLVIWAGEGRRSRWRGGRRRGPVRRITAPNPWVGCALVRDGEVVATGATAGGPGSPHAERVALAALAAGTEPAARPPTSRSSRAHHGRTPPCADALIAAGVARVVVGSRIPTRASPARASRGCAPPASRWCAASAPRPPRATSRPYLITAAPAARFVVKVATRSTAASPRPTARRAGSRPSRRVPTRTSCAPTPRPSGRRGHRARRSAAAHRARLPAGDDVPLGPPPLRVLLDAHGRVAAAGPLFDTSARADARRHHRPGRPGAIDAWARPAPRCRWSRPRARPPARRRSRRDARPARPGRRAQVLVEGGGALLGALLRRARRPARRLRRPSLLGVHGIPALAFDGPRDRSTTRRRCHLDVVRQLGPDVRLDYERAVPDVHRHRRGARHRARVTPNEGGARLVIEARTVLDDVELGASIAVNGCCLTVVAFDDDAAVGGRRGDRDARPHEPRRPRAPATP